MTRSRGQSVLYAVLLMPTLILVFALAVDIASLQMQQLRRGRWRLLGSLHQDRPILRNRHVSIQRRHIYVFRYLDRYV